MGEPGSHPGSGQRQGLKMVIFQLSLSLAKGGANIKGWPGATSSFGMVLIVTQKGAKSGKADETLLPHTLLPASKDWKAC